jgi:hypothetical protein
MGRGTLYQTEVEVTNLFQQGVSQYKGILRLHR